MFPKLLNPIIFALVACASTTALATPVWTVTATGTIASGKDNLGLFGKGGQDLTGLRYTQSVTTTVDPSKYQEYRDDSVAYHELIGGVNPFTTRVTVNGSTANINVPAWITGKQYLVNFTKAHEEPDEVLSTQFGYTIDGYYVQSDITVEAFGQDILNSIEFGSPISATLLPSAHGFSEFHLGLSNLTDFFGNIDTISVTGSEVPEPASLAVFGLGLAGLMFLRRKHRFPRDQ